MFERVNYDIKIRTNNEINEQQGAIETCDGEVRKRRKIVRSKELKVSNDTLKQLTADEQLEDKYFVRTTIREE